MFRNVLMHYDKLLPLRAVSSTCVQGVGYDENEWVLQLKFVGDGPRYNYFRVPPHEHAALLNAPSLGEYVNRQIRRYYECEEAGVTEASAG